MHALASYRISINTITPKNLIKKNDLLNIVDVDY